jgi:hypothetical protein
MEPVNANLRYVEADRLTTPFGSLRGAELLDPDDQSIGQLDGVVIDPVERQLRYLVVGTRRWFTTRHYLVDAMPARIEPDGNALHVALEAGDVASQPEVEPDSLPSFSDDDLIDAMFHGARP